jgi:hypothetical protein
MDSAPNTSYVEYGKTPEKLNYFKIANTTIFEYNGVIRFMHLAVLSRLEPETVYCRILVCF